MKKVISWNPAKNELLKRKTERGGICFEDCVNLIDEGKILLQIPHPIRMNQSIFILDIWGYPYAVPYVENETEIFLKTIFPARKYKSLLSK